VTQSDIVVPWKFSQVSKLSKCLTQQQIKELDWVGNTGDNTTKKGKDRRITNYIHNMHR